MHRFLLFMVFVALAPTASARAEDGYRLWLRYQPAPPALRETYQSRLRSVVATSRSATVQAAASELTHGLESMLGLPLPRSTRLDDGAILLSTPAQSQEVAALRLPLAQLGQEGFLIRSMSIRGRPVTLITGNSDTALLYGAFALLRRVQLGRPVAGLRLVERPRYRLRMLNHWDNLDGFVERGYAGRSLFNWQELPQRIGPRLTDYARANASVGINAIVLTNVNADARVLSADYIRKAAAIARVLRPWGMRIFFTARFSAPIELGNLGTADPLDPAVRRWWKAEAAAIYRQIPDFGGFLVKANSEGQPGPGDYGRSHADGANMLADALAPHGGTLMWRAFVYSAAPGSDRARQAYDEFHPLDGRFRRNVILQIKNGPIDFQPREPFHPLFGQMPHTPLAMEVQLTKEYLGFSTHLAFLAPMWTETLGMRTGQPSQGPTVTDSLSAMAGVANAGQSRNWTGSHFDQANWYAFGRLAWNPQLASREIADEWTGQTWSNDAAVKDRIVAMMLRSREAVVDYTGPLGLHHLMASGHHYGPGPWVDDLPRADWNPTYFHRADRHGIGFDRTLSGSNAVSQYRPGVAACWASRKCVPDELLLWFHRAGWADRMRSGRTLWEELVRHYDNGVNSVSDFRHDWARLAGLVDPERHAEVSAHLATQQKDALWWRDASLAYWQSVNRLPLPSGTRPPAHDLATYRALRFTHVPGNPQ